MLEEACLNQTDNEKRFARKSAIFQTCGNGEKQIPCINEELRQRKLLFSADSLIVWRFKHKNDQSGVVIQLQSGDISKISVPVGNLQDKPSQGINISKLEKILPNCWFSRKALFIVCWV